MALCTVLLATGCLKSVCSLLPAKYVIHTVGPLGEDETLLQSCYEHSLDLAVEHGLRSVAFCCISTGHYNYPIVKATHVALRTVRRWLDQPEHKPLMDLIVFCVKTTRDEVVYQDVMPMYFP
eukprot:TRINITY_DN4612_c0_g1_i1.p3 TRINITY_DN4612_c0_g1~~TRINITY_DN4612_c0_g1_i1.p3  ORF type:complete len:122 (+),score=25.80 TRINITY_DN4612_c0_g1_i1:320-685(+)